MVRTTKAQRHALKRVFDRSVLDMNCNAMQPNAWGGFGRNACMTYRQFRKRIHGGSGCIMVQWCGMWLGIEPDGYTHS
jgi:hypothetical protein